MAKKNAAEESVNTGGAATTDTTVTNNETDQIQAEIEKAQELLKSLKSKKKDLGKVAKGEKVVKGIMVAFRNKQNELITGMGTRYYVARSGGRLHYKAEDATIILPEGWKTGDAIPELGVEASNNDLAS